MVDNQRLYDLLGVTQTATSDEIKKAYKQASLRTHPDRHGGSDALFQDVKKAHDVLSDREKRSFYDQHGEQAYDEVAKDGGDFSQAAMSFGTFGGGGGGGTGGGGDSGAALFGAIFASLHNLSSAANGVEQNFSFTFGPDGTTNRSGGGGGGGGRGKRQQKQQEACRQGASCTRRGCKYAHDSADGATASFAMHLPPPSMLDDLAENDELERQLAQMAARHQEESIELKRQLTQRDEHIATLTTEAQRLKYTELTLTAQLESAMSEIIRLEALCVDQERLKQEQQAQHSEHVAAITNEAQQTTSALMDQLTRCQATNQFLLEDFEKKLAASNAEHQELLVLLETRCVNAEAQVAQLQSERNVVVAATEEIVQEQDETALPQVHIEELPPRSQEPEKPHVSLEDAQKQLGAESASCSEEDEELYAFVNDGDA